jgi:hypothetical protein
VDISHLAGAFLAGPARGDSLLNPVFSHGEVTENRNIQQQQQATNNNATRATQQLQRSQDDMSVSDDHDVEMGRTQSSPVAAPADASRRIRRFPFSRFQKQQQASEKKEGAGYNKGGGWRNFFHKSSARETISSHQQAPTYPQQHGMSAAQRGEKRSDLQKTDRRADRRTLPGQEKTFADRGDQRAIRPGAYAVDNTPLQSLSNSSLQPLRRISGPELIPCSAGAHPTVGGGKYSGKGVADRGDQRASQPGAFAFDNVRLADSSILSPPKLEASVSGPQLHPASPGAHPTFGGGKDSGKSVADRGYQRASQPGAFAFDIVRLADSSILSPPKLEASISGPQLHPASPGAHPTFGGGKDSGKGVADRGDQRASQPGSYVSISDASISSPPTLDASVWDSQLCPMADSGDTRPGRVRGAGITKVGARADEGDDGATNFRSTRQRRLQLADDDDFYDDDDSQELPGAFAIDSTREERRGVKGVLTESPTLRSSEQSKIESFTSESQTPRTLGWAPEAHNQSPSLDASKVQSSRFRSRWSILLAMILLVAVVTGIAVPLTLRMPPQATAPTVPPTAAPTAAPTSGKRLEEFIGFLEKISERELLENSTSPQGKAARWLANIDSARVDIKSSDLEERYLGTLFYYSTNSDEKNFDIFDYRSEESVCDWNNVDKDKGIFCNDGRQIEQILLRKLLEICCLEFCCIHRFLTSESLIADSNLKGPIPSEIFLLPSLIFLNLGKLLSFFHAYKNIAECLTAYLCSAIGMNKLTGTLPSEIGNCTSLRLFNAGKS